MESDFAKDSKPRRARFEPKHPLEYLTFVAVVVAAIAAGCAAKFTHDQVAIAKDTELRQLRAYVLVDEDSIRLNPTTNQVEVSIVFKNSGATPALEVSLWTCLLVGDFHHDETYHVQTEFPPPHFKYPSISKSVIGPGNKKSAVSAVPYCDSTPPIERPLRPDELARIRSGNAAIYFYGKLAYKDVFGITERSTNFSYWTANLGPSLAGLAETPSGNESN